ncbi:UNVERIFIED_CONTAM: hypothetical protein Sangu_2633400 [Sesamum angustifolium]|uniref:Uncharacterized protein n=1 Tax=Sesamum angustifolium TaxID=2727405 RepID=A0AAW2J3D7_9LAMI
MSGARTPALTCNDRITAADRRPGGHSKARTPDSGRKPAEKASRSRLPEST